MMMKLAVYFAHFLCLTLSQPNNFYHGHQRPSPIYNIKNFPQQQPRGNGFEGVEQFRTNFQEPPAIFNLPPLPLNQQHQQPRSVAFEGPQPQWTSQQYQQQYPQGGQIARPYPRNVQQFPSQSFQSSSGVVATPISDPRELFGQSYAPRPIYGQQNTQPAQLVNIAGVIPQRRAPEQSGIFPIPSQPQPFQNRPGNSQNQHYPAKAPLPYSRGPFQGGTPQQGGQPQFLRGPIQGGTPQNNGAPFQITKELSSFRNNPQSNTHTLEKPWIGDEDIETFEFVVTRKPAIKDAETSSDEVIAEIPELKEGLTQSKIYLVPEKVTSEPETSPEPETTPEATPEPEVKPEPKINTEPEPFTKSRNDFSIHENSAKIVGKEEVFSECEYEEFSDWTECSQTCGFAKKFRSRLAKGRCLDDIEVSPCMGLPPCDIADRVVEFHKIPALPQKISQSALIRLVSTQGTCGPQNCRFNNITEGRPEVFVNGAWGSICDDSLSGASGKVICRMLGLEPQKGAESVVCGNGCKGAGIGPIHITHLECSGDESEIAHCKHASSEAAKMCSHAEDIGVMCETYKLRLVAGERSCERGDCKGKLRSGRPEVFFDGKWGPICDTGAGNSIATVICKQMGLEKEWDGTEQGVCGGACLGTGSGPMMLDRVECSGSEKSLTECRHSGIGVSGCRREQALGVIC